MTRKKIIGIDLGTTNSSIAVIEGGRPIIVPDELGNRITPSVVRFLENGNIVVGEHAFRARVTDPQNTVSGIKRFIGRRYNEVMDFVATVPFQIIVGNRNLAMVEIRGIEYSPQEISAMILQYLKNTAEVYFGQKISDAVITIPAYFNEIQRHATKEAGEIAGLNIVRIINEPTAASMAYGLGQKKDETIAVFDLGGGTFDITILEVGEGVNEVKSIAGDGFLGGDNFDNRIVDWILEEVKREYEINLSNEPLAMQRVRETAIRAKYELSQCSEVAIKIPFLFTKGEKTINLELMLTRTKFEELCAELFDRLVKPCHRVLKDAGLKAIDLDEVLLVGGATRMPKVIDIVKSIFGKEPKKSINPDEAVAVGASIQAGVLGGDIKNILLLDVIPHSLGIGTKGGVTTRILEKGTTIPTMKSEIFSTMFENQTSVEINIIEGEHKLVVDNRTLGQFILDDIPPAPQGESLIEVTFDIDANKTINVSAKDLTTGKKQQMTITTFSGLSKDEIEYMAKEAESMAEKEKKRLQAINIKNQADSLLYQTKKILNANREQIPNNHISIIEVAIKRTQEAIESNDTSHIITAIDELVKVSHMIAEAIYGHQSGSTTHPGSGSDFLHDHDVTDPEFEDVN